jgi:hypothetical protein
MGVGLGIAGGARRVELVDDLRLRVDPEEAAEVLGVVDQGGGPVIAGRRPEEAGPGPGWRCR